MFDTLRACGAVELASSEEQPADHELGGQGYSVAFDPLDGSSIIGANWAVRGWRLHCLEGGRAGCATGRAGRPVKPNSICC